MNIDIVFISPPTLCWFSEQVKFTVYYLVFRQATEVSMILEGIWTITNCKSRKDNQNIEERPKPYLTSRLKQVL